MSEFFEGFVPSLGNQRRQRKVQGTSVSKVYDNPSSEFEIVDITPQQRV